MEKDYFKDRSLESQKFNDINIGDTVYICEKDMQKSATEISDLVKGIVVRKLTKHDHPRGIKVMVDIANGMGLHIVGRVVYKEVNGVIIRNKEGQ